jgi:hypothetical protein
LKCDLIIVSDRIYLVYSVYCFLGVSNSTSYFFDFIEMEQITLTVMSKRSYIVITDAFTKYFSKNFTHIFTSKILSNQSSRQNNALINAADVDFLMTNIHNTSRTYSSTKASHHTLHMNVYFFKSNSWKKWMSKHFHMFSDKNVRNNKYAVEGSPLLFWYFYTIFHQIN